MGGKLDSVSFEYGFRYARTRVDEKESSEFHDTTYPRSFENLLGIDVAGK